MASTFRFKSRKRGSASASQVGSSLLSRLLLAGALTALCAGSAYATQGTWTAAPSEPVNNGPAFGLWLLTDGTVLSHSNALNNWCKLVPGSDGNYADGAWVQLASSPWAMGGGEEHVVKDGRLVETGAEYLYVCPPGYTADDTNVVQVYDPVANTWVIGAPGLYGDIGDSGSAMLSNGTIFGSSRVTTAAEIYNPATDTWTAAAGHSWQTGDEDAWTSLQNGGVFSMVQDESVLGHGGVYDPGNNTWTSFLTPASFNPGDTGPTELLFDGRMFCVGLNGVTALFTPGATPEQGSWALGPTLPGSSTEEAEDAFSGTEPTGLVMFLAFPTGQATNELLEFNPTTNTLASITPPPDSSNPYPLSYCDLPNGQMMVCCGSQDWLYTPVGSPNSTWRPTISNIALNSDGSYTLTGTKLSGLINGWDEGDDMSGAENYPIVSLVSGSKVYYAKSYNFSNMMPVSSSSTTAQTCQFNLPSGLPAGKYSVYVSSVGVKSAAAYSLTTASDFTLWASPARVTIGQGATGTSLITVTESGGQTSAATFSASGLPSGVTASFSPTSSASSTTASFAAGSSAAAGTYTATIKGTIGAIVHSTTVTLVVVPTTLSAQPSAATISQTGSAAFTITVTPSNAFNSSASFSTSGLPSGVTASFSPTSATGSTTLTLSASSSANVGNSTVTVTGTEGGTTRTTTIALTVLSSSPPPPTAWWKFDEGSGTSEADSSGNGYTGTITNGTWTSISKVGSHAISFAGSGDMQTAKAVVNTASSFTVACWVKLNDLNEYEDFVTEDGANVSAFYLQYNAGNGLISFNRLASDSASAGSTIVTATAAPSTGTWYYVVGVADASAQTMSLYINGALQQTASFTTPWTESGVTAVGRGLFNGGQTDFLDGTVDDVRVYNSALTSTQVSTLYNSGG